MSGRPGPRRCRNSSVESGPAGVGIVRSPPRRPNPRSEEDLRASVSSSALKAYGPPEQLLRVTPDAVETTGTRCTVTRVAKFDTCPWGQLSKRPSQRNPWGPGYNIKLHCREKDGRTFN